jgi:hypothetical protein
LHFHGLHDEKALPGFDSVSLADKEPNDLARHWCDDLLPAFRFEGAMLPAAPGTWIGNLGSELLFTDLDLEQTIRQLHEAKFVGLALEQKGESVWINFDGIGIDRSSVQRDSQAAGVAL